MSYRGTYGALYKMPIWATAFSLYLLTSLIIDVGKQTLEGFVHNVSHAAHYGDAGLIIVILIGVTILKRVPILPSWLTSGVMSLLLIIFCLASGILSELLIIISSEPQIRPALDVYHNVIVAPIFAYLMAKLLPITFLYGTFIEKITSAILLLAWLLLN